MYLNPYIPKSQASLHLCSVVASSVKRVQRERGVAFCHPSPPLHPLDLGQLVLGFKGLRVEGFRGFRALGFRGFGV